MKLHYFPLSSYSQRARIAVAEKQASFAREIVDIRDSAVRERYRKISPLGKIPMLIADNGRMIAEASIIIEFLDTHLATGTRLIPSDLDRARGTRFYDRVADLYLNESITNLHHKGLRPVAQLSQEAIDQARFRVGVVYEDLDGRLRNNTWIMGNDFTTADCAATPALVYAQ